MKSRDALPVWRIWLVLVLALTVSGAVGAQVKPALPPAVHAAILDKVHQIHPLDNPVMSAQRPIPRDVIHFSADNPVQQLEFGFSHTGVHIAPQDSAVWRGSLRLDRFGYRSDLRKVSDAEVVTDGGYIEYRRGPLLEWYVNRSQGLEQGFTLLEAPESDPGLQKTQPLVLDFSLDDSLVPRWQKPGQSLAFYTRSGAYAFTYNELHAWDANGTALDIQMALQDGGLQIAVDDHNAVYPLTIDPLLSTESKLSPSVDVASGAFGIDVDIDGDTIIVGAHTKFEPGFGNGLRVGAAYVFVRDPATDTWSEQAKLLASDGSSERRFGWSVAVSGDTAVVGGQRFSFLRAYVFERDPATGIWTEQTILRSTGALTSATFFGWSVDISGDTIVVGASADHDESFDQDAYDDDLPYTGRQAGAVYVFIRDGAAPGGWSQQARIAEPPDGRNGHSLGWAVAIDGDTLVAGQPFRRDSGVSEIGRGIVYVRGAGGAWSRQAFLTGSDAVADDFVGDSVAIDADSVVLGASVSGSAYVFARSPGTDSWTQQDKLPGLFGSDHVVDVEGNSVVIGNYSGGGPGLTRVYRRDESASWNETGTVTASDGSPGQSFGAAVAVQGDRVVTGAPALSSGSGPAVYVHEVSEVFVNVAGTANNDGEQVVVTGTGVDPATLTGRMVLEFTLENVSGEDLTITGLGFESQGRGDEMQAITEVRLLDESAAVIASGTYNAANELVFSGLSRTLAAPPAGATETWRLVYDVAAAACTGAGGNLFQAKLTGLNVTNAAAEAVGVAGAPVTGSRLRIPEGSVALISGDLQVGAVSTPLADPFVAGVSGQSTDLNCDARVGFDVVVNPAAAEGMSLAPAVDPLVDETQAMSQMTLGNQIGVYQVHATLLNPDIATHGDIVVADGAAVDPVVFTATIPGIEISGATFDGNPDPAIFGTFIQNIAAPNIFEVNTVETDDPITAVVFELAGTTVAASDEGGGVFSASFDMQDLAGGDQDLTVTATTLGGTEFVDTATVTALPLPGFINVLTSIVPSISTEFQIPESRYRIGFSYPVDFVWDDAIDTAVLLLGGTSNEAGLNIDTSAFYNIDESSALAGEGSLDATLFGQDFSVEASLEGTFDNTFAFQGGNGMMQLSVPFTLPERGVSTTVLIATVPITVGLEVGGNGTAYVIGNAILGSELEFENLLVAPALNVTLSATATLSAPLNVATLGVNASPLTELELQLLYMSATGIDPSFGGRVTVPITVFGSIFWDTLSGDLASTTLGPYVFGTFTGVVPAGLARLNPVAQGFLTAATEPLPPFPEFFTTGDIAAGTGAMRMLVYTANTSLVPGLVDPDVLFRTNSAGGWSAAAPVATEPARWEQDPVAAFLSDGKALALWTSNDGAPTLSDLNEILAHQDIRYALWDGSSWSPPASVIDDDVSDGLPQLSYDAVNQKAVAVWAHDPNTDGDLATRSEWDVYTATYDETAGSWSAPFNLSGVDANSDFMHDIASAGGRSMAVWVQDLDGQFSSELAEISDGSNVDHSNTDASVRFALFDGNVWTLPAPVPDADSGTIASPRVAWNSGGSEALLVWISKANGVTPGTAMHTLHFSIYNQATDSWSLPGVLTSGENLLEGPQVVVDSSDMATILWRSTSADRHGDLFQVQLDLGSGAFGPPVRLTYNELVDWRLSAAISDSGEVLALWRKDDFTTPQDNFTPGLSDHLNFAALDAGGASLQPASAITSPVGPVDAYTALRLNVQADVVTPGDYRLYAELFDIDGHRIAAASDTGPGLAPGMHTFDLDFPGNLISLHNADGPYTIRNVVLLDEVNGGTLVDSLGMDLDTTAFPVASFAPGRVVFDRALYDDDTSTTALVTVTDAGRDSDPGIIEVVEVQINSALDTAGIPLDLTETEADSGVFTGMLGFNTVASNAVTGEIKVKHNSTVTATYLEPGNGLTWRAQAIWRSVVNTTPQIAAIADQAACEYGHGELVVQVSDSDGDAVQLLLLAAPDYVTLDGTTLVMEAIPGDPDGEVWLQADDGKGGTGTGFFRVAVTICPPQDTDTDGDGVTDDIDQCPATPPGAAVDANGCADSQKDTDGDGVTDDVDQCPATPPGAAVDANGCADSQKDTDNDGVTDDVDQCPATPPGAAVDANGCADSQKDSDGDGVSDDVDQCPGTPPDMAVDANGCADSQKDSDGDGASDDVDQCPGTPPDMAVDANGCADSQKDTDGDGVTDDVDQCPATPPGAAVDANGCADSQKDSDGDGVTDDVDQCPGTPPGAAVDANGCADSQKDSDGDGVSDDVDQCPGTPEGVNVGTDGCPTAQGDDADGDGVPDPVDACPQSSAGDTVNADGCAIADLCPCTAPVGEDAWKNHGKYVSCVAHASKDFVAAGLIAKSERKAIVAAAGKSGCGKKNRKNGSKKSHKKKKKSK